jgi:hypothetical protein
LMLRSISHPIRSCMAGIWSLKLCLFCLLTTLTVSRPQRHTSSTGYADTVKVTCTLDTTFPKQNGQNHNYYRLRPLTTKWKHQNHTVSQR